MYTPGQLQFAGRPRTHRNRYSQGRIIQYLFLDKNRFCCVCNLLILITALVMYKNGGTVALIYICTFVHWYICTFVLLVRLYICKLLYICTFLHLYFCTFLLLVRLHICTFVHLYNIEFVNFEIRFLDKILTFQHCCFLLPSMTRTSLAAVSNPSTNSGLGQK